MFAVIVENARSIGAVLACCTALGSGYVYVDGPIPATKQYVIAQTRSLSSAVIDNQLQTNGIERRLLRKERFDRGLELEKAQEPHVRSILQQRVQQIDDDLDTVTKERHKLEAEKASNK